MDILNRTNCQILPKICEHLRKTFPSTIYEQSDDHHIKSHTIPLVGCSKPNFHDIPCTFTTFKGQGETSKIIEGWILNHHPDVKYVIVGRDKTRGVLKWVGGSVSNYLIDHLLCKIVIVKE